MGNKVPFVTAALICERADPGEDGAITAYRIVDRCTVNPPTDLPPNVHPAIELTLLIILKSGDVRGKSELVINLRNPAGQVKNIYKQPIVLNGGEHGASITAKIQLGVVEYGLFWFDVFWNNQALTSVPLKLVRGGGSK